MNRRTAIRILFYVILIALLRPIVFGSQSRTLASEINTGIFSKYLTMPVNVFFYFFAR